jgi:hypothetical protein
VNSEPRTHRPPPRAQLAAFLAKYAPEIAADARAALAALRRAMPGAYQLVYDNYRGVVIGFSPSERPSDAVVSLFVLPDHLSLCFLQDGPSLPDPERLLKGDGNVVRHIKMASARELARPAVRALVREALKRADPPLRRGTRGTLIIRTVSAKQRPRRPRA